MVNSNLLHEFHEESCGTTALKPSHSLYFFCVSLAKRCPGPCRSAPCAECLKHFLAFCCGFLKCHSLDMCNNLCSSCRKTKKNKQKSKCVLFCICVGLSSEGFVAEIRCSVCPNNSLPPCAVPPGLLGLSAQEGEGSHFCCWYKNLLVSVCQDSELLQLKSKVDLMK